MKVLITGGGGFLGSHLAEKYLSQGDEVVCVDNFCTGLRSNQAYLQSLSSATGRLQFFDNDVIEPWESWTKKVTGKVDFVFHFASPASPPHYQRLGLETMWVNSLGLSRALAFADERGGRLVYSSTSEIYGDPAITPQPESYWGNVNTVGVRSCYDEAKRFGEALIFTHNLKYSTKHGLVRIFNTYGPRMNPNDGRVVINFLIQALRGEPLTIYGSGNQTRSFCYVDDLVAAIQGYAKLGLTEPVNIGNDQEFTISQAATAVKRICGREDLAVHRLPLPKDDPQQRRPDLSKAKALLGGWKPEVQLEEGLRKMRDWLKTQEI